MRGRRAALRGHTTRSNTQQHAAPRSTTYQAVQGKLYTPLHNTHVSISFHLPSTSTFSTTNNLTHHHTSSHARLIHHLHKYICELYPLILSSSISCSPSAPPLIADILILSSRTFPSCWMIQIARTYSQGIKGRNEGKERRAEEEDRANRKA